MSIGYIIGAAILLLLPVVALHEFGHFIVARLFKIKVLVYSIGFGPVLFKWVGRKSQVQYQLAAIPLGGYVKMADEREGQVSEADLPYAFNNQAAYKRFLVVAAGPMINVLLAIVLFWILLIPPQEQLNTRVWHVEAQAAAAGMQAGDLITKVDGRTIRTLEELNYALLKRLGESGHINFQVQRNEQSLDLAIPMTQFASHGQSNPLGELGFALFEPAIPPVIDQVMKDSPAAKAGIQAQDRIVDINGQSIDHWLQATKIIKREAGKPLAVTIERQQNGHNQRSTLQITPDVKKDEVGRIYGQIGASVRAQKVHIPDAYKQMVQYGFFQAGLKACQKTADLSVMTLQAIGKMISGLLGLENLSGPVTIAKVAGYTAQLGWQSFIGFMALMSITVGIMNLLPIPVLDGGHLVYYGYEMLFKKPMPELVQAWGMRLGVTLIALLMGIALFNDFSRLF